MKDTKWLATLIPIPLLGTLLITGLLNLGADLIAGAALISMIPTLLLFIIYMGEN